MPNIDYTTIYGAVGSSIDATEVICIRQCDYDSPTVMLMELLGGELSS